MGIDISDHIFGRLTAWGKSLEISMGETFSYLQAGLDITIKTVISRDILFNLSDQCLYKNLKTEKHSLS